MRAKLYLDNSTLEIVSKCETATILGAYHELSSAEESAPLVAGTAIHEVLAKHFSGFPAQECLSALDSYRELGLQESLSSRLSFENVEKIMTYWLFNNPVSEFPFVPLIEGIEKPLCAFLFHDESSDTDIYLVGMLDLPARKRLNNKMVVVDHKSTGLVNERFRAKFTLGSQVDSYLWLANQVFPDEHIEEMYINAIELSPVPNSNRKCVRHGVMYTECGDLHPNHQLLGPFRRTKEQLDGWYYSAVELARAYLLSTNIAKAFGDGVQNVQFSIFDQRGRFNGACQFCTFQAFCRMSRPTHMIESLLVHHPWRSLLEEKVRCASQQ